MLFTNREVRIEKNFAQGLECTDLTRLRAKFSLIWTDQGR